MMRRLAGLVRRHLGVDRLSAELQTSERNIERGVLYASRRSVGERYRYLLANFVDAIGKAEGARELKDPLLNPYPPIDRDRKHLR